MRLKFYLAIQNAVLAVAWLSADPVVGLPFPSSPYTQPHHHTASAQPPATTDVAPAHLESLHERLRTQEYELQQLRSELDGYTRATGGSWQGSGFSGQPANWIESEFPLQRGSADPVCCDLDACDCCEKDKPLELPVVTERTWKPTCTDDDAPKKYKIRYQADYDSGFLIRPIDESRHPYELQVNGWIQFRHVGFSRDVDSWTDSAGVTRQVSSRNNFDVERGRLIFSGFAISPKLTYYLALDGDTDGAEAVDFFDYFWAYELWDGFQLQMGKRKVPGSRQWLLTARRTRFVDRPMANDFFRPDRTTGVWGVGDVGDRLHYELMVANGLRTANLPPGQGDHQLAYAGTVYWDPLGPFGSQIVDFKVERNPRLRVGQSLSYAAHAPGGRPLLEADYLRLTDGTRLRDTGALAPGATVDHVDVWIYSADVAFKCSGWSIDAEYFCRWLEELSASAPLPVSDLLQRGCYVEGGTFLVPEKLDINARYSQVTGLYGNRTEYAGGINWYPLDTHKCKISFDVTALDGSPLNNTASEILVGDSGTLFRTQFQAEY